MGTLMFAIHDVELATFCGRIGNLYGRYRLCPPFMLRDAAQGWIAKGIPLTHCIDVIQRYLDRHAGSCYFGLGRPKFLLAQPVDPNELARALVVDAGLASPETEPA